MIKYPFQIILFLSCVLLGSSLMAKDKWLFGKMEHFEISSNASERRTKLIIEELQLVREVFKQMSPNLAGSTSRRLRVIICKDEKTMDMMVPMYNGKPAELSGMFHRDFEGEYILLNAEGAFEDSKTVVYHEFVHFLSNNRKTRLPPWLGEGIAEVFSTIEPISRNRVVIGNPPPGNVQVLLDSKMMPLERLFMVSRESDEYNSNDHGRGVFYAQSWALIHYFMFGKTDLPKGAFQQFVNAIRKDYYVSEDVFTGIFSIGFDEMEKRVDRYIRSGRYYFSKPDRPEIEGTKLLELREGLSGEENLVIGSVRLATRGPSESAGYLMAAYNALPDSADVAAFMGYLDYRNENYKEADKFLSQAVERGSDSPATHLWNAIARFRILNQRVGMTQRNLDLKTTAKLLRLLFKARELGETRPELYYTIGRVWIHSMETPTEGNVRVLFEGARLYREDAQLGFYLAMLVNRIGQREEAKALIEHYKGMGLNSKARKDFEWLESLIKG